MSRQRRWLSSVLRTGVAESVEMEVVEMLEQ